MRKRMIAIGALLVLALSLLIFAQSGNELFNQARGLEADGKYEDAIKLYQRIVDSSPTDKQLMARTLIQLGGCHELMGNAKGQEFYKRVLDEFRDQPDMVREANIRLAGSFNPSKDMPMRVVTPYTEDPFSFAISPDGRLLVFQATKNGKAQLWLRDLASGKDPEPIPGTEESGSRSYPFWQPESLAIGFFASGKLKTIGIHGGTPKELADAPFPNGGAWSKNNWIVFNGQDGGMQKVLAGGGEVAVATSFGSERYHANPQFIDDRRFMFYKVTAGVTSLAVGTLDSTAVQSLLLPGVAKKFAPPNQLLFVSNNTLYAQTLDLEKLEVVGTSVKVSDRIGTNVMLPGFMALSASNAERVAFREKPVVDRKFTWRDRMGNPGDAVGLQDESSPSRIRLSPDSRYIVYSRSTGGAGTVWGIRTAAGPRVQIGSDSFSRAVWSPDGDVLAMARVVLDHMELWLQPLNRLDGDGKMLPQSRDGKQPNDWSRNGFLLYELGLIGGATDLMAISVKGGEPIPVAQSRARESDGRFSPDGKYVAYQSDEISGRNEVFVQPFPGSASARTQVSVGGGNSPHWSPDGREIFYLSPDYHVMVAAVGYAANGAVNPKPPVPLFPAALPSGSEFDTVDGMRFLINTPLEEATPITILSGWNSGKK